MDSERWFSDDYFQARRRFCAAATQRGASCTALPLEATAADGRGLSIDIAWLGSARPRRVLLHSSGVHGVEGFAGSAIQLAALERVSPPAPGDAVVFVHALNPYGMARLRRCNENNVDLNRNFLLPGDRWAGVHDTYMEVSDFLNPAAIGPVDPYYLKGAAMVLRHGFRPLQAAIASGQYELPSGLFFGGKQLEQGPRLFSEWLEANLEGVEQLAVIDVHTGLGGKGQNSLFHRFASTPGGRLPEEIVDQVDPDHEGRDVLGYAFRGGQVEMYNHLLPETSVDFTIQEFGTYSAFRVLLALRAENYEYHHGSGDRHHPLRLALKEAFCPKSRRWRRKIAADGLALLEATRRWLFAGDVAGAVGAARACASPPPGMASGTAMHRH